MINVDFLLNSPAFGWETENYNFDARYGTINERAQNYKNYRNIAKVAGYIPGVSVITGLFNIAWGIYGVLQVATAAKPCAKFDRPKIFLIHIARGATEVAGFGHFLAIGDLFVTIFRDDKKPVKEIA